MPRLLLLLLSIIGFIPSLTTAGTTINIDNKPINTLSPENTVLEEQFDDQKIACMQKAELGEQLALKKKNGIPLQVVLNGIAGSHHHDSAEAKIPVYLVVEIERMVRDAYRKDYSSNEDVDDFVVDIFHSCLKNGW